MLEKMKKLVQCCMLAVLFACGCCFIRVHAAEFTDAVPVQVNQTVTGNVTEGYGDQQNYYMFTTTYPGSISINFANPMQNSSNSYWRVVLYNWEYKELLTEEIYGNKSITDLTSMGIPAGTYYVKVESTSYSKACSLDVYSLCINYTMSDAWEKELNDEFISASALTTNTPYYGTTKAGYGDEKDYYFVELEESGSMTVNFSNPLQKDTSEYWQVYLYDDEYTQIYGKNISGNVASTNLPATGLDAGRYYILVTSTVYGRAMSKDVYTLTLDFTASNVWEKERNEDFTTATQIETDTVYYGTTSAGYGYEKDYYSVDIPADGNYNIQIDTPNQQSNNCFWQVYLYDSSYAQLSSLDIYGNKTTHQITQKLEADTYYILVASSVYADAKSTDTYELLVTKKAAVSEKPKKVTLKSVKAGKNQATISWNKLTGVSGYEIYMSRSKSGGYKKIKTLSATSYKKSGLTRGKRYYFKVRAYKYVDGRKINGAFSSVKSALIK